MRTLFAYYKRKSEKNPRKIRWKQSHDRELQTWTPTFHISFIFKFHVTWTTETEFAIKKQSKKRWKGKYVSENPAITEQWSWTDYLKLPSSSLKVCKSRKQILKFSFEQKKVKQRYHILFMVKHNGLISF